MRWSLLRQGSSMYAVRRCQPRIGRSSERDSGQGVPHHAASGFPARLSKNRVGRAGRPLHSCTWVLVYPGTTSTESSRPIGFRAGRSARLSRVMKSNIPLSFAVVLSLILWLSMGAANGNPTPESQGPAAAPSRHPRLASRVTMPGGRGRCWQLRRGSLARGHFPDRAVLV